MNLGKSIRKFLAKKIWDPFENIDLANVVGWRSMGGSGTYGFYKDNQYENGYSSITKLSNGFANLEPYTIDKNGKPVSSNILDRVYTPNTDMSAYDFREGLAVCFLVMDKVRLRVHHKGNRITADSITGFTFLENYTERIVDGKRDYMMPNGDILDDNEVITLKSFNPSDVTNGFSASRAAKRWTRLDDYIADYQKGFFENGAVPAGQMIITARTKTEFNDIVDVMEAKHKGASKNNNITYTHKPTDANGTPMNAQIEWVPFSVNNKDLSLKDLFDNVNKKIDSVYGVPASIRGVNDSNTYASVRVDEVIFVKYALDPMCLKIWSKFNHELNRITGGTGVAISFDLEIPKIADEEKVEAEALQLNAATVTTLTDAGYTLDSAIAYVKTGLIDTLKIGGEPKKEEPDILDSEEQKDTPDQPIDIYSKRSKQVSARDFPDLYDDIELDPNDLGCIMLKVRPFQIMDTVPNAEADLAETVLMDRSPVPGETTPHVTLLYGLLENGNLWKDKVDQLLSGWSIDNITIEDVGYFELPDSYAVVAHVKKTTDLVDGHDRLTLLPHINTFSEYKPHITMAYIKKDADVGKWITALGKLYNGQDVATAGIDYGDPPQDSSKGIKKKQLSEDNRRHYEDELGRKVQHRMEVQINNVIDHFGDVSKDITYTNPLEPDENKKLSADMQDTLFALVADQGLIEHEVNTKVIVEADISTENIPPFKMTAAQKDQYAAYIDKVATGYNAETAQKIRDVISIGREEGASVADIKAGLSRLIDQKYRVDRLAISEVNRGGNEASLMSMKNIVTATGARVEKEWVHDGSDTPCEFCAAMIGTRVALSDNFLGLNETLIGEDGGQFVNDFVPIQVAELHPNGHCRQVYRVVKNYTSTAQKAKEKELAQKLKKETREKEIALKKLAESEEYGKSLESILDGQG